MPDYAKLLKITVTRPDPEDDHVNVSYTMENEDMGRTRVNSTLENLAATDIPAAIESDSAGYGVTLR